MNATELYRMLRATPESDGLEDYKVVTSDGVAVTGIWIDRDKKEVIMVQPSKTTAEYRRTDL